MNSLLHANWDPTSDVVTLNDLVAPEDPLRASHTIFKAAAINASGEIAATALMSDGGWRVVRLVPQP